MTPEDSRTNLPAKVHVVIVFTMLLARHFKWKQHTPPSFSHWVKDVMYFLRLEKYTLKGFSQNFLKVWGPFVWLLWFCARAPWWWLGFHCLWPNGTCACACSNTCVYALIHKPPHPPFFPLSLTLSSSLSFFFSHLSLSFLPPFFLLLLHYLFTYFVNCNLLGGWEPSFDLGGWGKRAESWHTWGTMHLTFCRIRNVSDMFVHCMKCNWLQGSVLW